MLSQRLSLPNIATPAMPPWRDNRYTRGSSTPNPLVLGAAPFKYPTPTADRDQTVSRRFKPSSRTSLNGEQPYPWDKLQPQDEMSRHRGAKHRRRYELLGGISLVIPQSTFLSDERWPFHTEPPDPYDLLSHLLRLVGLAVKHAYAIALSARFPTVPSVPSYSSVTLWEETAPRSNCLPCTVPDPDHGPRLEPQTNQGGISRTAPPKLAFRFHSLPPILHKIGSKSNAKLQ